MCLSTPVVQPVHLCTLLLWNVSCFNQSSGFLLSATCLRSILTMSPIHRVGILIWSATHLVSFLPMSEAVILVSHVRLLNICLLHFTCLPGVCFGQSLLMKQLSQDLPQTRVTPPPTHPLCPWEEGGTPWLSDLLALPSLNCFLGCSVLF